MCKYLTALLLILVLIFSTACDSEKAVDNSDDYYVSEWKGDVNINGVKNEIADAVVFAFYFVYGLPAFSIDVDKQIEATEINGDGYPLTVADLVYLIRIIGGDAGSNLQINSDAYANFSIQDNTITVSTNVSLGAIALTFEGEVDLSLTTYSNHLELMWAYDGQYTHALIYSMNVDHDINSGQILSIDGEGTLINAEAAEYRGARLLHSVVPTK